MLLWAEDPSRVEPVRTKPSRFPDATDALITDANAWKPNSPSFTAAHPLAEALVRLNPPIRLFVTVDALMEPLVIENPYPAVLGSPEPLSDACIPSTRVPGASVRTPALPQFCTVPFVMVMRVPP